MSVKFFSWLRTNYYGLVEHPLPATTVAYLITKYPDEFNKAKRIYSTFGYDSNE